MKKLVTLVLIFMALTTYAQNRSMELRHTMTAEEAKLSHLIGKGFVATDPPTGEVRNIAEFEPMEGVLITYHNGFGIGYNLISAMSQFTTVTTVVANESVENQVIGYYSNHGVNLDNCNFLLEPSNSYWSRDYGPWYIAYGEDQIGITDFIYNRPRPLDDVIPQHLADMLGIEWFGMDLIATGGNYMTDGSGMSFSTELITEENPDLTEEQINQMMQDYLGVNTYEKLTDPAGTYIKHIDCWAKLLDVDKYMVRSVPPSHPQYDEIEAVVDEIESMTSGYGTPYQIIRVYTPNNEPYTNSLILNDHVFVAVTGSEWDDEALATYENAMPGYTVVGITGNWLSTDALHCRTHGMADRQMMYIRHLPLLGNQPILSEYTIQAELTAYSGAGVNDAQVKVYYQVDEGAWQDVVMTHLGEKQYQAVIPGGENGTKIAYYIYAEDQNAKIGKHPFIGQADPHVFYVGEELLPEIVVATDPITVTIAQNQSSSTNVTIQNSGQGVLHVDFSFETSALDSTDYSVSDSPASFNANTYTEEGWEDIAVNESGQIGKVKLLFDWSSDNYPEDGSIFLESPEGTQSVITSGIDDGNYTFSSNAFNGDGQTGNWKLWIEDSYGDGGLQMTNVTLRLFNDLGLPQWLTLSDTVVNIDSLGSFALGLNFNSAGLEEGEYEGILTLNTNVETNPIIEIPLTLIVDNSVRVEDNPFVNKVQLANPFSDKLQIRYQGKSVKYQITDITGKLMSQGDLEGNKNISTQNWESGIYFLHLAGTKGSAVWKLVRQ